MVLGAAAQRTTRIRRFGSPPTIKAGSWTTPWSWIRWRCSPKRWCRTAA